MNHFKAWRRIRFGYESTEWSDVRHLPASCCGVPIVLIYLECPLFASLIRTHLFRAFPALASFTVLSLTLPSPQNSLELYLIGCAAFCREVWLFASVSVSLAGPCSVFFPSYYPCVWSTAPCIQWVSITCQWIRCPLVLSWEKGPPLRFCAKKALEECCKVVYMLVDGCHMAGKVGGDIECTSLLW